MGKLRLASFSFDITPPKGHSLCGGWIKPVIDIDDPLEAIGYVLSGYGKPIVICVLDWTGLLNSAHLRWRQRLAEAAGTTPDRVAVQCVHQHNAPFACLDAQAIVAAQGDLPDIVDPDFFDRCLNTGYNAVKDSIKHSLPVTHIAHGEAPVKKIAGNRRIIGLRRGYRRLRIRGRARADAGLPSRARQRIGSAAGIGCKGTLCSCS